jgi:hypothetical protein
MDQESINELSPEHCGLVIVDMQAEGCERHGAGVKPVIQNISALWTISAKRTERLFTFNQ